MIDCTATCPPGWHVLGCPNSTGERRREERHPTGEILTRLILDRLPPEPDEDAVDLNPS